MIPHERSLVEKYKSKPFAIVGVNTDETLEYFHAEAAKTPVTWRSCYDGAPGTGPITQRWNIDGYPAIFLIDAKGVIRVKNVRGEKLEQAIERLVSEAITEADKR